MSAPICPECGAETEAIIEEVDIGVGIQQFTVGYECLEHGGLCGICYGCGVPQMPGVECRTWCPEIRRGKDT